MLSSRLAPRSCVQSPPVISMRIVAVSTATSSRCVCVPAAISGAELHGDPGSEGALQPSFGRLTTWRRRNCQREVPDVTAAWVRRAGIAVANDDGWSSALVDAVEAQFAVALAEPADLLLDVCWRLRALGLWRVIELEGELVTAGREPEGDDKRDGHRQQRPAPDCAVRHALTVPEEHVAFVQMLRDSRWTRLVQLV